MPAISKKEAYLKRGGHEMQHIMSNVSAKRAPFQERPATVANFDFFKYGHSKTLEKHSTETCSKYAARARPVLKQRYAGYPIAVPDLSQEAVEETLKRRTVQSDLVKEDKNAYKKKFFQECTTDFFNQKHLIRDYLSTMHPYSDPDDRGRTYSTSRLKRENGQLDPLPMGDFIQPEDATRPRSTGYTHGHVRSMLHLDNFGPNDAQRNRLAREVGLLPDSPNIDRERVIERARDGSRSPSPTPSFRPDSPGGSTVSTVEDEQPPRRRPHTSNNDTADMYLPHLRTNNYQSNNFEVPHPDYARPGSPSEQERLTQGELGGLMPDQGTETVRIKRAHTSTGGSRPSSRGPGSVAYEDNADDKSRASRKSETSRGAYRPTVAPPNPNTQTGKLGYHGKAVGKPERLMVDPVSRGIEWYSKHAEKRKIATLRRTVKEKHHVERAKIGKEIDAAITDFKNFEVALEFRRTAKPADLPENNTRRAKLKKVNGSQG
jgi:hypothetical protein